MAKKKVGAQPGNNNARKHGAYSKSNAEPADLEASIADFESKVAYLSQHIEDNKYDIHPLDYAKVLDLLGRQLSRIARLKKQLLELTGGTEANAFTIAMDEALDKLSEVWGVEL